MKVCLQDTLIRAFKLAFWFARWLNLRLICHCELCESKAWQSIKIKIMLKFTKSLPLIYTTLLKSFTNFTKTERTKMKKYLYIMACALAFIACEDKNGVAFTDIENKSLIIDKIIVAGETFTPSPLQDDNASILFSKNDYNGFAGCNSFFGSLSLKGNKIAFAGNGGATKMLCPPEVMLFEDTLLSQLIGEFTLGKENDKLILQSKEMKIYFK